MIFVDAYRQRIFLILSSGASAGRAAQPSLQRSLEVANVSNLGTSAMPPLHISPFQQDRFGLGNLQKSMTVLT